VVVLKRAGVMWWRMQLQSCWVLPALAALLLAAPALRAGPASAPGTPELPDLEAAIVYQLLSFVDWPAEAAPAPGGAVQLCVDPASRLAAPLRSLQGRPVRQSQLPVVDLPPPEGLKRCHVVMLDAGLRVAQVAVRRAVRGLPLLVVGDETSGGIDDVVAVHLVPHNGRVGFEVDMAPLRLARLQISSRLLRLARRVGE
jgi:hypothetical protein